MIPRRCLVLVTSILTGCGTFTPQQVVEPSTVTVTEGVKQVVSALQEAQKVPYDKRSGLLVDEVTVQFNVAAGSQTTQLGKLTITNAQIAGGALGGEASSQNVSTGNRGNSITIKFKNFATADMSKSRSGNYRPCRQNETFANGRCTPVTLSFPLPLGSQLPIEGVTPNQSAPPSSER